MYESYSETSTNTISVLRRVFRHLEKRKYLWIVQLSIKIPGTCRLTEQEREKERERAKAYIIRNATWNDNDEFENPIASVAIASHSIPERFDRDAKIRRCFELAASAKRSINRVQSQRRA